MDENPKYNVPKNRLDIGIEILTFAILIGTWSIVIYLYNHLTDKIPIHFSLSGVPDNFASKKSIFGLLITQLFLIIGMFYLNKIPHTFNYPKSLNENNYKSHYTITTRMMRWLNLGLSLLFSSITIQILSYGLQWEFGKNIPIGILTIICLGGPLIWFLIQVKKIK